MTDKQQPAAPERIFIRCPHPQHPIGKLYKSHDVAAERVNDGDLEYARVHPVDDGRVEGRAATWGDPCLPIGFWSKTEVLPDGCWRWTGSCSSSGYSSYSYKGKNTTGHRAAYIALVGPITGKFPHGLTVDHLCRNKRCVNPAHMELVSRGENTLRGDGVTSRNKNKTHCINGHEFTPENTWRDEKRNGRNCRACKKAQKQEWVKAQRAKGIRCR